MVVTLMITQVNRGSSEGLANEARGILALDRRGITAYRSLGRSDLFEARSARKSGNNKRGGI